MSRTITAHLFYSLNGVAENPHLWQFDAFGPDEMESMARMTESTTDLVLAGLVDELTLTIHPVLAGQARRLFDDLGAITRLSLVNSTQTRAGNIIATYALRSDGAAS